MLAIFTATVTLTWFDLVCIAIFCFVVSGVIAYFIFDWLLDKLLHEAEEKALSINKG